MRFQGALIWLLSSNVSAGDVAVVEAGKLGCVLFQFPGRSGLPRTITIMCCPARQAGLHK